MSENLTLNMNSEIIEFANAFSRKINKPLSKIIEDYFRELKDKDTNNLPEDMQELYGIFERINIPDKKELRRLFNEKYSD